MSGYQKIGLIATLVSAIIIVSAVIVSKKNERLSDRLTTLTISTTTSHPQLSLTADPISLGATHDITQIPTSVFTNPALVNQALQENMYGEVLLTSDNLIYQPIVYHNHKISDLILNPGKTDKIGFFYYPNDNHVTDIALVVMDINSREVQEVYRNNIRTSRWEWKNTNEIIVYYNCGTACLYAYVIDANTGNKINEYHAITNYTPPPVYTP